MAKMNQARLRNYSLVLAVIGTSLVAGCVDPAQRDLADANSAASRRNWVQSTAFAERAYAANPTVTTKFNLANAYQRTGQLAKASALYEDVVAEGEFTPSNPVAFVDGTTDPNMLSPLSDEAARRVKVIAAQSARMTQTAQVQ